MCVRADDGQPLGDRAYAVGAIGDMQLGWGEAGRIANRARRQRQAAGQDCLEQSLRHVPDVGVPVGQQQDGGHRTAV